MIAGELGRAVARREGATCGTTTCYADRVVTGSGAKGGAKGSGAKGSGAKGGGAKGGGETFGEEYYDRFYGRPRTRVQGPKEVARLCRGVLEVARWIERPVASVAEVGAGTGLWRDWFARRRPAVRYVSTDVSPFACRRFGHRRLDIARARLRGRFDLVVCQGVLPYLEDDDALRAIDHLVAMTGGLLYLECQTRRDLAEVCDLDVSDPALRGRPARFYVERLERGLVQLGLGLWAPKGDRAGLYDLESGTLSHAGRR